jgi:plastocyanin
MRNRGVLGHSPARGNPLTKAINCGTVAAVQRTATLRRAGLAALAVLVVAGCQNPTNSATTPVTSAPATSSTTAEQAQASSSPAPRTATVGDTVAFENFDGTAGTVTLNKVRTMTTAEGPIGGSPTHGIYLVADVTLKSTSGSLSSNPLWFQVSTSDGTTYQSELGVLNNQLPSQDVPAGRQVRGEVAFDVPTGQPFLLDFILAGGDPLATFSIPPQS